MTDHTHLQEKEVATLAGGCFWGVEEIFRRTPGVLGTEFGYTGGTLENPTYEKVCEGNSGHAEAVRITFDPAVLPYPKLLWLFFRLHNPTTKNRQGNDIGSQYRSAIFYHSTRQRLEAEKVMGEVQASGLWRDPFSTELSPLAPFYPAEDYHQKYLEKHPEGYTCHYLRPDPRDIPSRQA